MKNMNKRRKGISLIVLVITILVMIILAGVVVVSLQKNNPIEKAKEANFKTDVSSFASELGVGLSNSLVENSGVKPEEIFANKFVDMKKYINSFSKKYENKLVIVDGKLTYIGGDIKEEKWSKESGIEVFKGVNKPVLSEGMIPIKYENNSWVICSENDPSWYNYGQKLWANIMLSDGKYKDKNLVGTNVADADLGSMFVWIPRYAYSINKYKLKKNAEGTEQNLTDVSFLNGISNSDMEGNIYSNDYDAMKVSVGSSTPKIVHPVFTFGEKQLSGIWIAKFEASMLEPNDNTEVNNDNTNKTIKILPNKNTWRYIGYKNVITNCFNMKNNLVYGMSNVDTHLIKNIEWGAIAYLCSSKYGITPTLNNNYNDKGNLKYDVISGGVNYTKNITQSTTGNVTGIYDLNGAGWEYVSAYYNNENRHLSIFGGIEYFPSNKLNSKYAKYFDVYEVDSREKANAGEELYNADIAANSIRKEVCVERYNKMQSKKGDAMYECKLAEDNAFYGKTTSGAIDWLKSVDATVATEGTTVYNSDTSNVGYGGLPFVLRGGDWKNINGGGVFASSDTYGSSGGSFRPVIINN